MSSPYPVRSYTFWVECIVTYMRHIPEILPENDFVCILVVHLSFYDMVGFALPYLVSVTGAMLTMK